MISLKRTAAILLATSLLAVSMAACSTKVGPSSSSSSNTSSASSDTSSVTSEDTTSVTSDTSSVDSITTSIASGTASTTTSTVSNKTTSSTKPTSSAKPTSFHTTSVAPSNSTSGIVKNMNGRTVVFHTPKDLDNGPKDKHVERMTAKVAGVEKQYNCKITIVGYDNAVGNTKPVQNSIIAGKPMVDIWWTQWGNWLPAYVAGLIQPLDAFKCFNFADKTKYFAPTTEPMIVNGVHYGLSIQTAGMQSAFQYDQMMFYRADVLQKSGVTSDMMPDTLAKNGQWTWDNFAKICQKVRAAGNIPLQDYAGSGGMNQVNLYQEMCYTFGTDYIKQDTARTVTFNGGSAAALSALNLYTSFVKNKTIDAPDCTKSNPGDMCFADNIAFSPQILCMAKWLYPRYGTEISKANWGMTYLPKVKASDKFTVVSDQLQEGECIPYGVKNPADAATVLQALTPLDNTDYTASKAETMMDYELWLPSNQAMADSVLRIENEVNALAYLPGQQYFISVLANGPGVSKDWLTHVQKIATGQEDAAAVIAANTGKYNGLLKDLYVIR